MDGHNVLRAGRSFLLGLDLFCPFDRRELTFGLLIIYALAQRRALTRGHFEKVPLVHVLKEICLL